MEDEPKQIKVLRCLDSILWYNKHVGETFEVQKESDRYYWVREKDSWQCLNFVLKSDAQEV